MTPQQSPVLAPHPARGTGARGDRARLHRTRSSARLLTQHLFPCGFCPPQPSWTAQSPLPHTSSPGNPCRIPALDGLCGHSKTLEGPNQPLGDVMEPLQRPKVGSGRAEQGPAGSAHGHWVGTAPFSNSPCTFCILLRLGGFTQWQRGLPQVWGSQGGWNKALYSSTGLAPLHPGWAWSQVEQGWGTARAPDRAQQSLLLILHPQHLQGPRGSAAASPHSSPKGMCSCFSTQSLHSHWAQLLQRPHEL